MNKKHENFRRLAEKRTNKALEAISLIGNLSNRQNYDWDDSEIDKIIRALKDAISEVDSKFTAPKRAQKNKFTL